MITPLLAGFMIEADDLGEELCPPAPQEFSLPGADTLLAFADLLGGEDGPTGDNPTQETPPVRKSAPFPLPAMLPQSAQGKVVLSCEIDFGALGGDRAVLTFDSLCGRGTIRLGAKAVARFGDPGRLTAALESARGITAAPCRLAVDVTPALLTGKKETLFIHFDDTRPAGVPGPVFLQTTRAAHMRALSLTADAHDQTVTVRTEIAAQQAGLYVLRVQCAPGDCSPAREISVSLAEGETRAVCMTIASPLESAPWSEAPIVVSLLKSASPLAAARRADVLCERQALVCGYPAKAPNAVIPLEEGDLAAHDTISQLAALFAPGVLLSVPAPDSFLRALTLARIPAAFSFAPQDALLRHPCVSRGSMPASSGAPGYWRLLGVTGLDRAAPPDESDMLIECFGRRIDPAQPHMRALLARLDALHVRLFAEAARQSRATGCLCRPGQWRGAQIADALRRAYAPAHLSALPLYGAWWAGSRFICSLCAFAPQLDGLAAHAALIDETGAELARLDAPVSPRSGYAGTLECPLPDASCRLSLRLSLTRGEELLEQDELPVYVGRYAPLEKALEEALRE